MIIVATAAEEKIAKTMWPSERVLVTGVGGLNVIRALSGIDRGTEIINFGYAGSNVLPIGETVSVGKCKLYHPNVEYAEPEFELEGDILCLTSNDFVTRASETQPVVFDMELAYILAMGFGNVRSIKIVSDNLSLQEYERQVEKCTKK